MQTKWLIPVLCVCVLIIVPFALWGARLDDWTARTIEAPQDRTVLGLILFGLLATDIVLPVPSSTVSTACGYILGLWPGIIVSWAGMSLACFLGYILAAYFGRPLTDRLVGKTEVSRLEALSRKHGNWAIIIARPVPVLAEASVLFAGLGGMRLSHLMFLTGLSNAGISAVYVAVGAFSMSTGSFALALLASILLPLLALSVTKLRTASRD
jgi:uncharacterized membrane protein YdjX (TVP38/TMEM64 family)